MSKKDHVIIINTDDDTNATDHLTASDGVCAEGDEQRIRQRLSLPDDWQVNVIDGDPKNLTDDEAERWKGILSKLTKHKGDDDGR